MYKKKSGMQDQLNVTTLCIINWIHVYSIYKIVCCSKFTHETTSQQVHVSSVSIRFSKAIGDRTETRSNLGSKL